ncbi:toll/interleukin-1 receptor domain-containing protein [Sphingomonas parva]|nr:toll/interleukin-1 receptor domain-containing protein [Sphingomonas parva]
MAGEARFKAFLSYSHKDARHARWLHRRLEAYRLPRRLVGSEGERGLVPARIAPIFRDREELPAAGDLSEKVRAALAASEALVILCSPHSAGSPWVAKEIATFRSLQPDRPILAAIVDGEPAECFPCGLAEGGAEPLAADLRAEGDGRRLGVLKLVAGLAGVDLDALVQRDAQRRLRRVTAVTVGALLGLLITSVLAIVAFTARAEAERQRAEAEGLVEFMLTDLRDKLKGVGRLDALTSVNERALKYYQNGGLEGLSADSLERRARILTAMGEDDMKRSDFRRALAQFREAARTTTALLADDPENPQRIYAHAQSEFWVGYIDYAQGRTSAARRPFERYLTLAEKLVSINPADPKWLKEAGYASGNLCSLALEKPVDAPKAVEFCQLALKRTKAARDLTRDEPASTIDLLNRHLWLMKAYSSSGMWSKALYHKKQQDKLMRTLMSSDRGNSDYQDIWMRAQYGIGDMLIEHGEHAEGVQRLSDAAGAVSSLMRRDPENREWKQWNNRIKTRLIEGGYHGKSAN